MKKTKRIVAFALAAVLALLVLAGCKSTLTSIAHKLTGSSDEVQEEDTTQWAVLSSDPLMIDGIADTSAKYATAMANGSLNIVFNGIWSRQTDYFTVPGGSLTITGYGTAEGTQRYKVSVWQKVAGGAQYVNGSTYYIKTDGQNYRCVISGLDPAASYRLTISYDSSRYYLYGGLKVEGIAG
jgi:outer membrane murein-binding lipoprotein Lpp